MAEECSILPGTDEFSLKHSLLDHSEAVRRLKERLYDHNLGSGHIAAYEPLLDDALADYFPTPHMQKHLKQLGLV